MTREQLHRLVDVDQYSEDANWYVSLNILCIVVSIVPLAFKDSNPVFDAIEYAVTVLFTIDYLIRWATADFRSSMRRPWCFVLYPLTPMAIIDLLSMLPTYLSFNASFRLLRATRLLRVMKVSRVFKAMRYSASVLLIQRVLRRQRDYLIAVSLVATAYVLASALVLFNIEPATFDTFFDAIYWATVSLTTVGYGDIFAKTTLGRLVTMVSSAFGIAIVALPASIITAGFMEELRDFRRGEVGETAETDDGQSGSSGAEREDPAAGAQKASAAPGDGEAHALEGDA